MAESMTYARRLVFFQIALIFFGLPTVIAQDVITNHKGEQIVVYPDGSWKPLSDGKTESENHADQIEKLEKYQTELKHTLLAALEAEKDAFRQIDAFQKNRVKLEDLIQTEREANLSEFELNSLRSRLKVAKKEEKLALKQYDEAHDRVVSIKQSLEQVVDERDRLLKQKGPTPYLLSENRHQSKTPAHTPEQTLLKPYVSVLKAPEFYKKPVVDKEGLSNIPGRNCILEVDGKDALTGRSKRITKNEQLFFSLPERLKPFLKGEPYISGKTSLIGLDGGKKFVSLEIHVKSANAQREFGGLSRGRAFVVHFLDGSHVALVNRSTDKGTLLADDLTTVFYGQYAIEPQNEKKLSRKEVDMIRLVWDTGYEDYQVYDVDIFKRHFVCLNQ